MAVDPKLIKKADLARVREIDFTLMFTESLRKLTEALGVTRKVAKQAGTVLKSYKATGTLEEGKVAEGETIPLSKYTTKAVNYGEIALKKWRKATSAEEQASLAEELDQYFPAQHWAIQVAGVQPNYDFMSTRIGG